MALSLFQTVTAKFKEIFLMFHKEPQESKKPSPTPALPKLPSPGEKEVPVIHITAKTSASKGVPPNGQAYGTAPHPLTLDESSIVTVLGTDIKTGQEVTLSLKERYMGLYVIGATGTGKTTLDLTMILSDIKQGL
jgi:DNA segregation ATPase FtsK/SpoIIIE-like protein